MGGAHIRCCQARKVWTPSVVRVSLGHRGTRSNPATPMEWVLVLACGGGHPTLMGMGVHTPSYLQGRKMWTPEVPQGVYPFPKKGMPYIKKLYPQRRKMWTPWRL